MVSTGPATDDGPLSPQARVAALITLTLSVVMAASTEFMPAGLLSAMAADLDTSEPRIGLLVTSFALAVAAFAIPLTRLTARLERRRLLILLMGGYVASNGLMAVAPSFLTAAIARLGNGICHAVLLSVVPVMAGRLATVGRLGRTISVLWVGTALATTAFVPLGALVGGDDGHWRWVFAVLAGFALMIGLAAPFTLPRMPAVERTGPAPSPRPRGGPMRWVAATTVTVLLANFVLYSYISFLLIREGMTQRHVGVTLFSYGLAGVAGLAFAAFSVDRWPRQALIAALAVQALSLALFPVAPAVAVLSWGFAFGSFPTFFNTAALRAADGSADVASASTNAAFNLGVGAGALLGSGVLRLFGHEQLSWVAATIAVIGLGMVITGRQGFPPLHSQRSEPRARPARGS
jgi:predicted MFS family arabinose efflux permease